MNIVQQLLLLKINITKPSMPPKKQSRSTSVTHLQPSCTPSIHTTSRRNLSCRSQLRSQARTKPCPSLTNIDTSCCSANTHAHAHAQSRNISKVSCLGGMGQLYGLSGMNSYGVRVRKDGKRSQSKTGGRNGKESRKETVSKIDTYARIVADQLSGKIKTQKSKKSNKTKSGKKIIKDLCDETTKISNKSCHKKSCKGLLSEVPEQSIKAYENSSPIEDKRHSVSYHEQSQAQTEYVRRQPTPHQTPNLHKNTSSHIFQPIIAPPRYNDIALQTTNNIVQQLNSAIKGNQEHEQTMAKLQASNFRLKQEIQQINTKYEEQIKSRDMKVESMEAKRVEDMGWVRGQVEEEKKRTRSMQAECQRLKSENIRLLARFDNDIELERRERRAEKEQLLRKVYENQQKIQRIEKAYVNLQAQLKEARDQSSKISAEKQKYQKVIKKYQQQLSILQNRLQAQTKLNKQNEKKIEALNRQKKCIKQNTQIALEIVRNQIRHSSREKDKQSENFQTSTSLALHKQPYVLQMSPKRRSVLGELN